MNTEPTKPQGYEEVLGEWGAQLFDGYCGEPIKWGWPIKEFLGQEKFDQLGKVAGEMGYDLSCIDQGKWFVLTHRLTIEQAISKYGHPVLTVGPRGGFRSVSYGDMKFLYRRLDPRKMQGLKFETEIEE